MLILANVLITPFLQGFELLGERLETSSDHTCEVNNAGSNSPECNEACEATSSSDFTSAIKSMGPGDRGLKAGNIVALPCKATKPWVYLLFQGTAPMSELSGRSADKGGDACTMVYWSDSDGQPQVPVNDMRTDDATNGPDGAMKYWIDSSTEEGGLPCLWIPGYDDVHDGVKVGITKEKAIEVNKEVIDTLNGVLGGLTAGGVILLILGICCCIGGCVLFSKGGTTKTTPLVQAQPQFVQQQQPTVVGQVVG